MATATKSRAKPTKADIEAAAAADRYIVASNLLKTSEDEKKKMKAYLIDWLGDASVKTLHDGRTITKVTVHNAELTMTRKAHDATTVTIAPPPPFAK